MTEEENQASEGTIWVCAACGKTAKNRVPGKPGAMPGWDESCMLKAVLVYDDRTLQRNHRGYATSANAVTP